MPTVTLEEALHVADQIPGWMAPWELEWLGIQAAERKVIVEVGCYRGRSTKMLALMTPGVVYAVDDFRGEVDPPPVEFGEPPSQGKSLYLQFHRNLEPQIKSGKVKVIQKASLDAVKTFRDKANMVFIDGDHKYPAPVEDIKAWYPKLAPKGLLCGHDSPDPGVQPSLQELAIVGRGPDRIWFADEDWSLS